MNYETATDGELNIALANALGQEIHPLSKRETDRIELGLMSKNAIHIGNTDIRWITDPCTDWSFTMPLAVEYGVSLIKGCKSDDGFWFAGIANLLDGLWEFDTSLDGDCVDFETYSSSPLRAIVICLIKVLEANNA